MQFSSVDLPQPEGPRSTMNSPSATSRLSDLRTETAPKFRVRSRTETECMDQPFTAPAAMPRTKSLPETK
jgi:hypothetical protein